MKFLKCLRRERRAKLASYSHEDIKVDTLQQQGGRVPVASLVGPVCAGLMSRRRRVFFYQQNGGGDLRRQRTENRVVSAKARLRVGSGAL